MSRRTNIDKGTAGPPKRKNMMCPHCGELFYSSELRDSLIPTHDFPRPFRSVCPGSKQSPRNADSDKRPLWKDDPELDNVR